MSVTVDFLFKASKDGSFNSILKQVTDGLGKLSDEAEKSGKKIENLISGKFKNAPLGSVLKDITGAINTGDIQKVNDALINTEKILSALEKKVDDTALKNIEKLTQAQMDDVLKSVTKKGSNKAIISKMINDRALKNSDSKDLTQYKKYLVSADEAHKKLKELQENKIITKNDIDGIKDYVGYYERLVQLNEKITDDTIKDDMQFIIDNFDNGKYKLVEGIKGSLDISEIDDIKSGIQQLMDAEKQIGKTSGGSTEGMSEVAQEIKDAAQSIKDASQDLKDSAQSIQDSTNSLNDLSDKMKGLSEVSSQQSDAVKQTTEAINNQVDSTDNVKNAVKEQLETQKELNDAVDKQVEKTRTLTKEEQDRKKELRKEKRDLERDIDKRTAGIDRIEEVLSGRGGKYKYKYSDDAVNALDAADAMLRGARKNQVDIPFWGATAVVDWFNTYNGAKRVVDKDRLSKYNNHPFADGKKAKEYAMGLAKALPGQKLKVENEKARIDEIDEELKKLSETYSETSASAEQHVQSEQKVVEQSQNIVNAKKEETQVLDQQQKKQISAEGALSEVERHYMERGHYNGAVSSDVAIEKEKEFLSGMIEARPTLFKDLKAEAKELKAELKPVNDMITSIKNNSSVKDIDKESFATEAANLDEIIATTQNMEEYVTAMLKMNKLIDAEAKAIGGVKGSGAKNKQDLRNQIFEKWAKESGIEGKDFSRTTEALFGDQRRSLFSDLTGKVKSMDELVGMIMGDDLRSQNYENILDLREQLSAVEDAMKFMKNFMKETQDIETQAEQQAASGTDSEGGLSGYWNIKVKSMEAGIQSYKDKLKTDGDTLIKKIVEESKKVEEAEQQFADATAFMMENSDISTGGTSAGSNNKSQSTVDLLVNQALERANKEVIAIQQNAEEIAKKTSSKGISSAEQYKTDTLEKGRSAIHQAIQEVIDEEIGQTFDYYIGNMDISESTKAKVSRKDADKAAEEALIKANKDGIAKQKKMREQQAKQMADAVDYYVKNTEAIGATDVKSVVGDADKSVEEALQKANEEAIRKQIEKLEQQQVDAINYYVEQTEAIGVTQGRSTVVDGDKAVEDAMREANAETMKVAREAQIKSIEDSYKNFTGSKQTTYLVNKAKPVRTEQQNRQIAEYEAGWNQVEEAYNQARESFANDADALKRIEAARTKAMEAGVKAAEAVNETAQQKAEQAAQKAEEQAQKAEEKAAQQQQRRKNKSSKVISGKQIKEAEKYIESVKDANLTGDNEKISTFYAQINAIKEMLNSIKSVDIINDDDTEQVAFLREQTEALTKALEKAKATGKDVIDVSSTEKALNMQEKIGQLMQNANLSNDQYLQLSRYNEALKSGNVNSAEYDRIAKGFSKINSEVSKGNTLVDAIQHKFKNLAGYLISFMSFYRIIGTVKQMANTVREFDDAFTEMRKVSDESIETLKAYQKESYDMAASVGTDALSLQKSTADWMRLGESLEEAKKSATASNILLNVSEFDNIDQATTSLVAMSSAYKDLDKMEIIDKLNKVGKIELPKHMVTYGMVA